MSLFCLSFVVEPGLITLLSARTYALFKQKMNHFRIKDRNLNILLIQLKIFPPRRICMQNLLRSRSVPAVAISAFIANFR